MRTWRLDLDGTDPRSPRLARSALTGWLEDAACTPPATLDATIVVAEVVTDAVIAGSDRIEVEVALDDGRLRVDVRALGDSAPIRAEPQDLIRRILVAATDACGWTAIDGGRHVWAERLC